MNIQIEPGDGDEEWDIRIRKTVPRRGWFKALVAMLQEFITLKWPGN